jgi:hypothetical protein
MPNIHDQLHQDIPFRGCVYGLLFSIPLWLLMGLFSWWIFTS